MNRSETAGARKPLKQGRVGFLADGVTISLTITIILCILALCQHFYGIGLTTRHEIRPDRILKMADYSRWKFPEHYRTPLMERRALFFQNDEQWVNLSVANRDLKTLGPGWFHWTDDGVNFIPKHPGDLENPAIRYSVISPLRFKPRVGWILGTLLLGQLLLFNRMRAQLPCIRHLSPDGLCCGKDPDLGWAGEVIVFICALVAVVSNFATTPELTDHAFMVKGIPESDAMAWYDMGVGLSEGRGLSGGFQNQRPFYSIYLGGLFSLFGVKLTLAQGFNALALAVSSAGIFTLGRLLQSRWLGLVLSISAMSSSMHLDYVHAIISENGGLALAVLSLLSAWLAAWTLSLRWSFVAGLLNGLAALTSGITILTLPLYVLIITVFPMTRRTAWKRAVHLGLVYTLGATLLVGSWIVRQKIVNDKWTLSYNTSEVLAGGADPETGRLTLASYERASIAGIDLQDQDQRYDYFLNTYKATVSRDPGAYVRQVGRAFLASIDYLPWRIAGFHLMVLLGLFGFGIWPALMRGQWIAFPLSCLLIGLWVKSGFDLTPTMLAAAVFLVWRRCRAASSRLTVLLLTATVLATMMLAALSGNVATKRFWLVSDWAAFALLLGGTKHLIVTSAAFIHAGMNRARLPTWLAGSASPPVFRTSAFTPPPFIAFSSLTWLAFTFVCSSSAMVRQFRPIHSPAGPLTALNLEVITDEALAKVGPPAHQIARLPRQRRFSTTALLGDFEAELAAGEGTQHWMQIYAQRPYHRWVAKLTTLGPDGTRQGYLNTIGRGTLDRVPRDTPLIVVGVLTDSVHRISQKPIRLFEVCLIIPLKRPASQATWSPDYDRQIWFPPTAEALSAADPPVSPP